MNIPIYQAEIKDGLADQIQNNSVACYAVAEANAQPSPEAVEKLQKILAANCGGNVALAENKEQIDLFYLKSILVSTGWNKNDDVFDPKELWEARNTPEDKPFNFMHDESDIIGHITANEVVDFEGNPISEDLEPDQFPRQFNILTSAVIYTEWSDPERRDRISKIVAEIEDNKWFVSMECLFPNFDYALSKGGETKVIRRDQASAFLTKHLRAYGGDGKYEDYQVGRLLRNLSFSGKGLVSKPANPNSVILDRTGSYGGENISFTKDKTLTISSLKEMKMSDSHDKQIDDLRAELAEAKAANEALQEKVAAEQQAEFDAKIATFEATLAEKDEQISGFESKISEIEATVAEQTEKLAETAKALQAKEEELAAMHKQQATAQRKAQLTELGFDDAEASETVEQFDAMDDDTFTQVVALMKKKGNLKKGYNSDDEKKDDEEEEKGKGMPKNKAAELEDEVETAEASETDLDSVEETEEVAIAEAVGDDDPAESLRAQASEWLGSVLQYVPKDEK